MEINFERGGVLPARKAKQQVSDLMNEHIIEYTLIQVFDSRAISE